MAIAPRPGGKGDIIYAAPLAPRVIDLVVIAIAGGLSGAAAALAAILLLFAPQRAFVPVLAALAVFLGALTAYGVRDLRGKSGLRIVLEEDAVLLDLPADRSLIHRPPAVHTRVPYTDIAAIETRLEAYPTLGVANMQRAYVLRRGGGELIFLFEERALGTALETSTFPTLAHDIATRAGVPLVDLGMVEGNGGVLGVWGTEAPDWSAASPSPSRQLHVWRLARLTGALLVVIILIAVILRILTTL